MDIQHELSVLSVGRDFFEAACHKWSGKPKFLAGSLGLPRKKSPKNSEVRNFDDGGGL